MCENADKYRGFQIFETLLVVLNVVGSSPTGHPKKSPVIREIAGLLHFQSMRFNRVDCLSSVEDSGGNR